MLSWVEQLTQPAGDILENALAEGAKLLETAEKDVQKGKELAERCARKEAEISVRYKFR